MCCVYRRRKKIIWIKLFVKWICGCLQKTASQCFGYTYWGYRHGGRKTNKCISPLGFQKFLTKNPFTEEHLLLLLFKVFRILESDSTLEDNSKYTIFDVSVKLPSHCKISRRRLIHIFRSFWQT